MRETYVTTRVGRLRTLQSGPEFSKRALLCWPGLGVTAGEFHRLLREGEARHVAVIAIDPPGHGRSDPAPRIEWADAASVVRDVAMDFPASRFLLVGHSAGATALLFGAQGIPDRLAGIVLGDGGFHAAAVTGDEQEIMRQNEEWLGQTFRDWAACLADARADLRNWDDDVEAAIRDLFHASAAGAIALRGDPATLTRWLVLLRDYAPQQVPQLDVPALVLWAAQEPTPEPEGIAALRARLPRLRATCLVGSGHELFWDQPEAASRSVWDFFEHACDWGES